MKKNMSCNWRGFALILVFSIVLLLLVTPMAAWAGPNSGAGCAIDMDISTTNYDSGITATDIESTRMVQSGDEFWVALVAQNVSNLDTYQVEVNFDGSRLSFLQGAEESFTLGITNLLKKNGGRSIGFQAILKSDGVVNVANSLVGSDTATAPEGTGVIGLLKFRVLSDFSTSGLNLANVFFIDSSGADDSIGQLANATINGPVAQPPTIHNFSVNPSTIQTGNSAVLTWNISGAQNASIDNGIGSVDPKSGTRQVIPTQTTTYKLTATGSGGSVSKSVTLTVTDNAISETVMGGPGDGSVVTIQEGAFSGTPTSSVAHEHAPARFSAGIFEFTIQGLVPGSSITIALSTPMAIPSGSVFHLNSSGSYTLFSGASGLDDGDNVFSLAVTDSGDGDVDGTADGSVSISGGPGETLFKLYYPHVPKDLKWGIEIAVINDSLAQNLSGEIRAYDSSGNRVSDTVSVALPAAGRQQIDVRQAFSSSQNIGYLIFVSTDSWAKGYLKFFMPGSVRVGLPAVSRVNQGDLNVSHVASNNIWYTGLAVVNTTLSAKTLSILFDNGDIKTVSLQPNEHKSFTVKSLFDNTPQINLKAARITGAEGVIGLELFGAKNRLSGILLSDETENILYYPHVASNTIWYTGIVAYNPTDALQQLIITAYDENGTFLKNATEPVGPRQKYLGEFSDLNLPEATRWLKIRAATRITGFELFGTRDNNQLGGYTGVGLAKKSGILPKLEKDGYTGIACVNIAAVQANVTITAYDDGGRVVAAIDETLAPGEKLIGTAEKIFTPLDITAATHVRFTSDQDLVCFQLNGASDQRMLDAIEAM